MFHSNPKSPVAGQAWAVQFLTRDYLVQGLLQSPSHNSADYFADLLRLLKQTTSANYDLPLVEAHVQPTGNLTAPARTFARLTMRLGSNLLGFAPADDASQAALHAQYANYKLPFPATLYMHSYLAQANVLADNQL